MGRSYDISTLEEIANGNADELHELLVQLVSDIQQTLGKLHGAKMLTSPQEIYQLLHRIKPAAKYLGMTDTVSLLKISEQSIQEGAPTISLLGDVAAICKIFEETVDKLKNDFNL